MNVYDEIDLICKLSSSSGELAEIEKISTFAHVLDELDKKNRERSNQKLQPWLGLLEFGLKCIHSLYNQLLDEESFYPKNPAQNAPFVLMGTALSFGSSIRTLSLSGLDTPSRALLRAYTETLFLSLATLYDEKFAQEYVNAQADEDVKEFWHKHVSPKKLNRALVKIEQQAGVPAETTNAFASWRKEEYTMQSQAVHPSYVACSLSILSYPFDDEENFEPSHFGFTTQYSVRTLSYASRVAAYFIIFAKQKIVAHNTEERSQPPIDDENHERIKKICNAYLLLTAKYWES